MAARFKLKAKVYSFYITILLFDMVEMCSSSASANYTANQWLSDFQKARAVLNLSGKTENNYVGKLEIVSDKNDFKMTLHKPTTADDILVSINNENTRLDVSTLGVYDGSVLEPCCKYNALVKVTTEGVDAIINMENETYIIEPWSRFEQGKHHTNNTTTEAKHDASINVNDNIENADFDCILYTARDVLENNTRAAAAIAGKSSSGLAGLNTNPRVRRSAGYTECSIHIVADDTFYRQAGHSDVRTTLTEMMFLVRQSDMIFRGTDFNGDGSGDNVGFYVTKMTIYTHSNEHGMSLTSSVSAYLNAFSKYDFDNFCLAVAFTSREFADGVIGLAWVASSNIYGSPGGICQKRVTLQSEEYSLNTALVTTHSDGNMMPSYKSVITLAHEFGHNFGSPHDKEGDLSCTPDGNYGNFLMYPYATDGSMPNNRLFSPCSIGYMFPVIRNKATCFTSSGNDRSICGNGIIEDGEDCDCGSRVTCADIDPCCTPSDTYFNSTDEPCKLRTSKGSECSPRSSPCCNAQCKIIITGALQQCRAERDCSESEFCDGSSAECPTVVFKSNGTDCDGGTKTCNAGSCTGSICAIHGTIPCACSSQYICDICCQSNSSSACVPTVNHAGQLVHKPLGQTCEDRQGYCDGQGKCVLQDIGSTLDRLHEVFTKDSMEGFKTWLKLYWYYVVAAIGALAFMIAVFVFTCRGDDRVHTSAFMHGQFGRIQREAELQKQYIESRKSETKSSFDKQLRNLDGSCEMCLTTAIARLMMFFPTAPKEVLMQTLETSANEEAAVRWMLLRSYPIRRVCIQQGVDKQENGVLQ